MKRLSFLILLLWVFGIGGDVKAVGLYDVIDLGKLDGATYSYATGINENNQVVGHSGDSVNFDRAFIWDDVNGMQALGMLGDGNFSYAYGINDSGQVAGAAYIDAGGYESRAFTWDSVNGMQSLGTLDDGSFSEGDAINNNGTIVGGSDSSTYYYQATNSVGGILQGLEMPAGNGGWSQALGVNDAGTAVGYVTYADGTDAAAAWNVGNGQFIYSIGAELLMTDGTQADFSYANAINEAGWAVGSYGNDWGNLGAFLWLDGAVTSLGKLPGSTYSEAYAVNESGQIVGFSSFSDDSGFTYSDYSAFLWENGVLYNLNDHINPGNADWTLYKAQGINNRGYIVGSGLIDGEEHAYLLKPVPEPGTLLLVGAGFIGLTGIRRKGRKN